MGAVAIFSYAKWIARYPEFAAVSEGTAAGYFGEACIYHCNDGTGPVCDPNAQLALLNMMTAHIAARYAIRAGKLANPLVGRIASATEGSVTVSVEDDYEPGSDQWYQQTPYGSDYFAATTPYRTALYRAPPGRNFDGFFRYPGA